MAADAVWTALADPQRRALLDSLRSSECTVGELGDAVGLSQPSTSKHLRVLREAGLVTARVDAQRRIHAIDPDGLQALDRWLAPYRRLWNTRLDALSRHLDRIDPPGTAPPSVAPPGVAPPSEEP